MPRREWAKPGAAVRAGFTVMASRRDSGKPENNTMKILFESLLSLVVLVPVFMTILLLSCLFMAGLADRISARRFSDGENWQPVASDDFEAHRQQP